MGWAQHGAFCSASEKRVSQQRETLRPDSQQEIGTWPFRSTVRGSALFQPLLKGLDELQLACQIITHKKVKEQSSKVTNQSKPSLKPLIKPRLRPLNNTSTSGWWWLPFASEFREWSDKRVDSVTFKSRKSEMVASIVFGVVIYQHAVHNSLHMKPEKQDVYRQKQKNS